MLLRHALGETLRDARTEQSRTLREVSTIAKVSLGYLSEIERGRKEASSELLASICDALDLELADVLGTASNTIRADARHGSLLGDRALVGARAQATPTKNVDDTLRIVMPYRPASTSRSIV